MTTKTAKVIGRYVDNFILFSEPAHRPAQASDVIELDGAYWRMFSDGQRLHGHDVTQIALDALATRLETAVRRALVEPYEAVKAMNADGITRSTKKSTRLVSAGFLGGVQ